ncbi:radical SAM protein [Desulfosarcina ovata subsp. sediminis]|uniref:Radical SAM protein n=1 Tax=Desulfosarcina ovata subsp. sediminis TaxID=885957 RepID=A0A5K7ZJE5_9BACT|nr:radical SAM protein [Desulfosarcina ovata]BBO80335.1 radical SAM protein [Desulfosarcina ovata subsp. sediminis]
MATIPLPAYIGALERGTLEKQARLASAALKQCTLCPRRCKVDRTREKLGFCRTGKLARVASFNAHFGEEAPLVGENGSGTIFFSHCNLLCNFCQNYAISHLGEGDEVTDDELADIMLQLQGAGCHNINLVTPSHVVPQIIAAVGIAARRGLTVPLVFNSGGYDRVDTLKRLDGIVDIYMPDFKFWDEQVARDTCNAPDYPAVARKAILEMHRQVGDLCIDKASGLATRGLLVRHLVLPGGLAGTSAVMGFLAEHVSRDTYVNVMAQYRPCGTARQMKPLDAPLSPSEYETAVREAMSAGITRLDRPRRVFQLW